MYYHVICILLSVITYLIIGYYWTLFFRNHVLDDGVWNDTGDFSLASALMLTLFYPLQWAAFLLFSIFWCISQVAPLFRKLYRLDK